MDLFSNENSIYVFILFLIAVLLSTLINGLFVKFSNNLGMRNTGDGNEPIIRWASTSKPAFGGISFFILFLFSFAVFAIFPAKESDIINKKHLAVLLCSTIGFLIGLADDAYNTKPLLKFSGQLLCAIILLGAGIWIDISPSRIFNYIFTIFWVIGIMNSVNMLDNMDGVVSSISIVIILGILSVCALSGIYEPFFFITSLGVVAALLGFLFFNWNPSKMYMGDTGSQFLGAFLSAISILFIWNLRDTQGPQYQIRQFVAPMLIFIVPLIDTTTVSIRRMMRGHSPFVGGRDHITHHLAMMGVKDYFVCTIYVLLSALSIGLFLFLHFNNYETKYLNPIAIGFFMVLFIIIQLMYQKNAHRHQEKKDA
ncbi:MAG: putative undecaprenyl-phosphate N-acetylglucosaminyl 1-phosphate transferase [Bacteroidota bacterium]|jgi:UDP-GlcNAc:undecaprenyl-phosphate/decaprenyl-phosphate GlcNAc-1-phosphate transferase